jgi:DNA polymerase-3 subunit chi
MPMPTRVTFYVLESSEPADRLGFSCRLAEKAWKLGNRIHAHLGSAADATRLDDLLWTFRQGSFVPHEIVTGNGPAAAPVTIGADPGVAPDADLLINLADEVPAGFERYARVAEVIDGSEASRQAGRRRHRHYQEAGLTPETHAVGGSAGAE